MTATLYNVSKLNSDLWSNTLCMSLSIISCCGGYFMIGIN